MQGTCSHAEARKAEGECPEFVWGSARGRQTRAGAHSVADLCREAGDGRARSTPAADGI